jgi:hypothetical protein
LYYGPADLNSEVEFREVIKSTIPCFIQLLKDEHEGIRLKIIQVIGKLANSGEWSLKAVQHS